MIQHTCHDCGNKYNQLPKDNVLEMKSFMCANDGYVMYQEKKELTMSTSFKMNLVGWKTCYASGSYES